MAHLVCTNLSVGFSGEPIVTDVSFSVSAGEALFVLGENGAGKSTLIKTILGLQPALGGEVSYGDGTTAHKVGYLPQRAEMQKDFPASAWEVVLSGRVSRMGLRPFFSQADKSMAREAARRAGASDLLDRPYGSLSGGQQQRVLLARALATEASLLVLDEPTTGLDPEACEALYQTLDDLRTEGVGVLAVTHDVGAALPHATHVLVIRGGTATYQAIGDWKSDKGGLSWTF